MRKIMTLFLMVLAGGLLVFAQENGNNEKKRNDEEKTETAASKDSHPEHPSYYRLNFTIREVEEKKTINSRNYDAVVEAPGRTEFKVGSRLPIVVDAKGTFQYIDVGVNFNYIRLKEQAGLLAVEMSGEISNMAPPGPGQSAGTPPLLRQARFEGPSFVTPGKPAVLFSLDDVDSNHRFEIELMATKLR